MDWCYEAGEPLCEEVRFFLYILLLKIITFILCFRKSHMKKFQRKFSLFFRIQKSMNGSIFIFFWLFFWVEAFLTYDIPFQWKKRVLGCSLGSRELQGTNHIWIHERIWRYILWPLNIFISEFLYKWVMTEFILPTSHLGSSPNCCSSQTLRIVLETIFYHRIVVIQLILLLVQVASNLLVQTHGLRRKPNEVLWESLYSCGQPSFSQSTSAFFLSSNGQWHWTSTNW